MGRLLRVLPLAFALFSTSALCGDNDLVGTYSLVSSSIRYLDNGEVVPDQFGKNAKGFIMYGADGRMLVLVTFGERPKPESTARMTDDQRSGLFRTMLAYGGTYTFVGDKVEHHVDICWDELRCGQSFLRYVIRDGDRLTYTTHPAPSPFNGRTSVATTVWQKVK